jgi:hypothetical protein
MTTRRSICAFSVALVMLVFAGCQSLSDVKPGDGKKLTIEQRSYDEIWRAALRVTQEHFEIREQDRSRGTILAERTRTFMEAPSWIGVYITPSVSGASSYTVEVVRRKWMTTNVNVQDWERKVLRDLEDVRCGRTPREGAYRQRVERCSSPLQLRHRGRGPSEPAGARGVSTTI